MSGFIAMVSWLFAAMRNPWLGVLYRALNETVAALPAGFADRVYLLVQQAAVRSELHNGAERMRWVLGHLKSDYPEVGTEVMRRMIENVLGAVEQK